MNKNLLNAFLIAAGLGLAYFSPAIASQTDGVATDTLQKSITPGDVVAQPVAPASETWTFDDCVNWATANTTDIRRNLLDILQAEQDVASAKDAWLPQVGFSTSHSYSNYPSPGGYRSGNTYNSSYQIAASWTAWEGNVRKYNLDSSRLLLQQKYLAGEDLEKTLRLSILQAYINILYSREAVEIAQQTLEVSNSQTERAKRLMESGRTSKVDYAQIESQQAQDAYNLVQAQNSLESARLELKKILELRLNYNLRIAPTTFTDADVLTPLPEKESVFASALAWLPDFKSNLLNKEILVNDVRAAKAGYLPTISVSGGVGTGYITGGDGWGAQMGNNFNENIGVTLSVPIFDGNQTKRNVAKARLAELDYDLTQKNLLDDLSRTIESLYIDASNARAKYVAGQTQLKATALTNELTQRQFELGLVNPLELLTAHNNYLNARIELLQSKYMALLAEKTILYYANREINIP